MPEHIASRDNERVKYAYKLSNDSGFRRSEGLFFAEGRKLCMDLASSQKPKVAFFTQKLLKQLPEAKNMAEENFIISEPVADKLSTTRSSQELYCLFQIPTADMAQLDAEDGVLVCETLQDPANVGTVLRSAAAFGIGGVVLLQGSADPFSPRALRASMGAALRLPIITGVGLDSIATLKESGVTIYATALDTQAVPLDALEVKRPFALLLGNEGAGLSRKALALADTTVYIPMQRGVESLNAAAAASVLLFYVTRGR